MSRAQTSGHVFLHHVCGTTNEPQLQAGEARGRSLDGKVSRRSHLTSSGPLISRSFTLSRTLGLTPKQSIRNSKADFTFLVSWWAPNADAEAIRTMVDWQHWAFPWDDQFDEGHFKEDIAGAAADIIHMTSILDDSYPPIPEHTDMPLRYAFQQNWFRIRKVKSAFPPLAEDISDIHITACRTGVAAQVQDVPEALHAGRARSGQLTSQRSA